MTQPEPASRFNRLVERGTPTLKTLITLPSREVSHGTVSSRRSFSASVGLMLPAAAAFPRDGPRPMLAAASRRPATCTGTQVLIRIGMRIRLDPAKDRARTRSLPSFPLGRTATPTNITDDLVGRKRSAQTKRFSSLNRSTCTAGFNRPPLKVSGGGPHFAGRKSH